MSGAPDDGELGALEEERRFLLASLHDLEREHAAGDVDDADYRTLRDGYTARAADVLRRIEEGRAAAAPRRPVRRWRVAGTVVVAALVAAGIGVALAGAWGERAAGEGMTGFTPGDRTRTVLAEARAAMNDFDFARANELFVEADRAELERGGENAEARTYVGWTYALSARFDGAEAGDERYELARLALDQAIAIDPTYADPYCFVAILEYRFRQDAEAARPYVEECAAGDPPADVRGLVEGLAAEIDATIETGTFPPDG